MRGHVPTYALSCCTNLPSHLANGQGQERMARQRFEELARGRLQTSRGHARAQDRLTRCYRHAEDLTLVRSQGVERHGGPHVPNFDGLVERR